MFAVVIAIPALAHWRFGMNAILAFWLAYIATRPLGASFADWMGVSHGRGGLDYVLGVMGVLSVTCVTPDLGGVGFPLALLPSFRSVEEPHAPKFRATSQEFPRPRNARTPGCADCAGPCHDGDRVGSRATLGLRELIATGR
jgi:Repeat of Unknown Function (DUF347)